MKRSLLAALTWTLATTAVALECQTCTDIQCSSTVLRSCSTERWCMTASIKSNASGTLDELDFKGCAPDALCTARGFDTFSANFGGSTTFSSIYCCKSNNCNTANVIFLTEIQSDNSLQCTYCQDSQCNSLMQCRGLQDRCFSSAVTQGSRDKPFFGCVSTNVCEAAAALKYLPFLQSLGNITGGPSCCSNSGCNRASAAATAAAAAAAITLPEEQNCVIIIISGAPELPLVLLHLLLGLLASIVY
ncbi:uncharacterized protein LOC142889957 [Nelusetta ayraudi]|uniref:uncharacterized protein LOC142889957 n=1 Tax=Nelusetta ayraudi TaxID=303726 RepID=UPI003F716CBC